MPAKFEPTNLQRETVRLHAMAGTKQTLIASCILNDATGRPISEKTLREHFRAELDGGAFLIQTKALRALVAAIDKEEAWAICFFLKARMGWSEKPNEIAPPDIHVHIGGNDTKL